MAILGYNIVEQGIVEYYYCTCIHISKNSTSNSQFISGGSRGGGGWRGANRPPPRFFSFFFLLITYELRTIFWAVDFDPPPPPFANPGSAAGLWRITTNCSFLSFESRALKVDIQRYFTLIIFHEIAQWDHANPSNGNFRPHGKH